MRTLALGKPDSAFFRTIRRVLPAFGEVEFRSEYSLIRPASLVRAVERGGFERVLMANPYGNRRRLACYDALHQAGVVVIASDRGALPGSWFFDRGFNADSPTYRPDAWDHPLPAGESERVRRYMRELREADATLESQGDRAGEEALRSRLGVGDAKVLFVPLQRPGDTVVRYFAGDAGSMDGFVDRLRDISLRLSVAEGTNWKLVVKRHPLEREVPAGLGDAIVEAPADTHVHDLLELADATLALNSGVGLLSLIFDKPTFHAGEAFYGGPGLASPLPDLESFVRRIDEASPPDAEKVERFVFHLLERVYSFGAFDSVEVEDQRSGARRRVTRDIRFESLRILGVDVPLPRDSVLVVSPVVPYPIRRGSESRVDGIVRALLSQDRSVSLCVMRDDARDGTRQSIEEALRTRYADLHRLELVDHPRLDSYPRRIFWWMLAAADLLTGGRQRISNLRACPWRLRRRVRSMMAELVPRAIMVNYAKMGAVLPARVGATTILDTHDDQTTLLIEGQRHSRNRLDVLVPLFRWSERRVLRRFDRVVAINPEEVAGFEAAAPDSEVICLPAFSDAVRRREDAEASFDALFVGSGSSFNVNGLGWFLEQVLPRILAERPDFTINIVGDVGDHPDIRAHASKSIILSGRVPTLEHCYASARLVLAPIRAGAGMKIKTIEALAYGKAVIATRCAGAGIAITSGESGWIADSPESFADGVLTLLADDTLRLRIEEGAEALHAREHSPVAAAAALTSALN